MDLLTIIWTWITSVYAKTIGAFIMWLIEVKKKYYESQKAKYETLKIKRELIEADELQNRINLTKTNILIRIAKRKTEINSSQISELALRPRELRIEFNETIKIINKALEQLLREHKIKIDKQGEYYYETFINNEKR